MFRMPSALWSLAQMPVSVGQPAPPGAPFPTQRFENPPLGAWDARGESKCKKNSDCPKGHTCLAGTCCDPSGNPLDCASKLISAGFSPQQARAIVRAARRRVAKKRSRGRLLRSLASGGLRGSVNVGSRGRTMTSIVSGSARSSVSVGACGTRKVNLHQSKEAWWKKAGHCCEGCATGGECEGGCGAACTCGKEGNPLGSSFGMTHPTKFASMRAQRAVR